MSLEINIVDPLEQTGWDQFILGFKGYTFFHSTAWSRVLKETYGYQPVVFRADIEGKAAAIFPLMQIDSILTGRRGVSLPFSDFCESFILNENTSSEAVRMLLDFGCKKKWKYVELRGNLGSCEEYPFFANYYHHELDLVDEADLVFKRFRSSTRRNVNKAINAGVTAHITTSFDAIEKFYTLNCITRKRHGLPPQPFKLFRSIYQHVISKGNGFVVTAEWESSTIGAAIFMHFGDKALYKYGASDLSSQHLRANNLIMWEAIKWYCQNDFKTFSFGRTDIDHEGLLQFKRGWGVREELVPYYRFDLVNGKTVRMKDHKDWSLTKYSSMLPIAALRAFGTLMYRHVG